MSVCQYKSASMQATTLVESTYRYLMSQAAASGRNYVRSLAAVVDAAASWLRAGISAREKSKRRTELFLFSIKQNL